ncbi:MAG: hypothetical protein AAF531_17830 [Actinomycetota bacterium]
MRHVFSPSHVMQRDRRGTTIVYTVIAVLVALAMFVAAAGAGPEQSVTGRSVPQWFDVGANVLAIGYGILVLIPRTRALGAILAVFNMFGSMYVNYEYGGVDFFVDAIPYNTVTIMLGSLLIGHYAEDLAYLPKVSTSRTDHLLPGGDS